MRHVTYWVVHISIWAGFWFIMGAPSYTRQLLNMTMWVPMFIFFSYPLVYLAIPHLLLKEKIVQFFIVVLAWAAAGMYFDVAYRSYIYIPLQEALELPYILPRGPIPSCYLCMTTSAASPMIIRFFKLLTLKQRDVLHTQQEKTTAELQLLKAQVHPHFLFNTLNNIYSFSLLHSPKTPELILKLSSLLHYMMYDCKAEEVKLEKEIEVMKNYIDLERERYGNRIEISWNVSGDVKDIMITPLLLLPFLENAFKHGIAEQIEKPKLMVDIVVRNGVLSSTICNSKNNYIPFSENGIGIDNVKKRLELLYPNRYELHIKNEEDLFTVFLQLKLAGSTVFYVTPVVQSMNNRQKSA